MLATMGYRGYVEQREVARARRAEAATLAEIATELGVAKSTVSVWVRDVPFTPRARRGRSAPATPHPFHLARLAEIEHYRAEGLARIGQLSNRDLRVAGTALYAAEGTKRDGSVAFANTDPHMIHLFLTWLRTFFSVDEARLRLRLYLHEGLDLDAANRFWSDLTGIPSAQFRAPYRAADNPTRRHAKHPVGCPSVLYGCSATHRAIMGLVAALLLSPSHLPG